MKDPEAFVPGPVCANCDNSITSGSKHKKVSEGVCDIIRDGTPGPYTSGVSKRRPKE